MSRPTEALLDEMITREGGFVYHQADRGGPTKYGITQWILSERLGRLATVDEARQLDKETAREIDVVHDLAGPRIDTLPRGWLRRAEVFKVLTEETVA